MEPGKTIEGFFICEQLGHKRLAGYVQEVTIAGTGFLRIDIPGEGEELKVTQYILPSTIYCLTPCSEEITRKMAAKIDPRPPGVLSLEYEQQAHRDRGNGARGFGLDDEDDDSFEQDEP